MLGELATEILLPLMQHFIGCACSRDRARPLVEVFFGTQAILIRGLEGKCLQIPPGQSASMAGFGSLQTSFWLSVTSEGRFEQWPLNVAYH